MPKFKGDHPEDSINHARRERIKNKLMREGGWMKKSWLLQYGNGRWKVRRGRTIKNFISSEDFKMRVEFIRRPNGSRRMGVI